MKTNSFLSLFGLFLMLIVFAESKACSNSESVTGPGSIVVNVTGVTESGAYRYNPQPLLQPTIFRIEWRMVIVTGDTDTPLAISRYEGVGNETVYFRTNPVADQSLRNATVEARWYRLSNPSDHGDWVKRNISMTCACKHNEQDSQLLNPSLITDGSLSLIGEEPSSGIPEDIIQVRNMHDGKVIWRKRKNGSAFDYSNLPGEGHYVLKYRENGKIDTRQIYMTAGHQ